MSVEPPDEPSLLGGVWVGPGRDPTAPASEPPRTRRIGPAICLILALAGAALGWIVTRHLDIGVTVTAVAAGSLLPILAFMIIRSRRRTEPSKIVGAQVAGVVYTPPEPDADEAELAEMLMRMCRGDVRLFDRLLNAERRRHRRAGRAELLRLAIDHFRRDVS